MSVKMRKWLATRPASRTDWAYILKDACWKPIKSHRTVTRGKKKGWIEVTLFHPEGRKRIVPAEACRFAEIKTDENSK
jgi:hypothetical protein